MSQPLYLDHAATTPVDPRVLDAMLPWFSQQFGNAASRHHSLGCDAAKAVERSRELAAAVIRADPREIVFTSGATESNNLALLGVAASAAHARRARHVVTVRTEHKAVLDPCRHLEQQGFDVRWLSVDRRGRLDLDEFDEALTDQTLLVSIMHANNETGVLHPLAEIGRRCRERRALFHTDATQSYAKQEIDVDEACVDLLSFSAHKIHGPKGAGGLYVRRKGPRVRLDAQMHGGGHERGMRSGTANVPGIVGLAEAARLCAEARAQEQPRLASLRDRLHQRLTGALPEVHLHGDPERRLATILNLGFVGVDGESLMRRMPGLAVSSASACTSAALQPSYVLGAMGVSEELAQGAVRFSLGRTTTAEEIEAAAAEVIRAVTAERAGPGSADACAS